MNKYLKSQLLKVELEMLYEYRINLYKEDLEHVINAKHAVTTLKNVFDFFQTFKPLYRTYPSLSKAIKNCYAELEFFNYIRNNLSGHISQELVQAMLCWKPELKIDLLNLDVSEHAYHFNRSLVEYVFNSYVTKNGTHQYYKNETIEAVEYDYDRFRALLIYTIEQAIECLKLVSAVLQVEARSEASQYATDEDWHKADAHVFERL